MILIYPFIATQESPEVFLTRISSKHIFKLAKPLLSENMRLCGKIDSDGTVHAIFLTPKTTELIRVSAFASTHEVHCDCSLCGQDPKSLCQHAFAALLYHYKYEFVKTTESHESDEEGFRGLKNQSFVDLSQQCRRESNTHFLTLEMEGEFPHIPSKWEQAKLLVTLTADQKKYRGNLLNLRQLHFEKSLLHLKLEDLTLQERQIIRYLAINAQGELSTLHLGAEQTAEFLHCLIDFPRFFRNSQRIIVHSEPSTPALIITPKPARRYALHCAIRTPQALITLDSVRVITGRNGVWVGLRGEYYWINGRWDVGFLRSFFRHGTQEETYENAQKMVAEFSAGNIEIVEQRRVASPKKINALILLDACFMEKGDFSLQLDFSYASQTLESNQARQFYLNNRLALRDHLLEASFVDKLRYFGFEQPTVESSIFVLKSLTAAHYFLTDFLPELCATYTQIRLSQQLIKMTEMFEVTPRYIYKRHDADFVYLEGGFSLDKQTLIPTSWFILSECLKKGERLFLQPDQTRSRITDELAHFMSLMRTVVAPVKGHDLQIRLARANVPFWVKKGITFQGLIPPELWLINQQFLNEDFPFEVRQCNPVTHPFVGELRPYQKEGVDWLVRRFSQRLNVILADEMGLGKTVQTLALMAKVGHLTHQPHLLVCPTSLTENWRREALRFVPTLQVEVIDNERDRKWDTFHESDLLIVSYAILRRDLKRIQAMKFTMLVLDEAQHIKNPTTANAKSCKSVVAQHKLVLTGTPLENSPQDLWSIFDFIQPQLLGALPHFLEQYMPKNQPQNLDGLIERIAPFILRRKKIDVCSDLPPKTEQIIYCQMQTDQRTLYNDFLSHGRLLCMRADKKQTNHYTFDILAQLLRLRQICCDPALLGETYAQMNCSSAKMDTLFELLEETLDSGHRVLLFSQFTSVLALIRKRLEDLKLKYCYLDGQTKERQTEVDRFNESKDISLFLLSLKAGGTGLNLTSADTIILYDPWWNPAVENQAADRAHRIGQSRHVNVIRLVAQETIEDRILKMQASKQKLFNELIEDSTQSPKLQKLSLSELEQLFM